MSELCAAPDDEKESSRTDWTLGQADPESIYPKVSHFRSGGERFERCSMKDFVIVGNRSFLLDSQIVESYVTFYDWLRLGFE